MPASSAGVLFAAFFLVSTAAAPASSIVDRPTWTTGDSWTYRTNTTLTADFNLTGEATSTVTGTQMAMTGAASVSAWRIVLSGSGTAAGVFTTPNGTFAVSGRWVLTGEQLLEPTGLHPIYSLLDLSVNGTFRNVVPFSIRVQNTTTFEVLSDGWRYPLSVGGAGQTLVAYNFTQDFYNFGGSVSHLTGAGQSRLDFSMGPAVSIAAPAGVFTAYPVLEAWPDRSYERAYFAPAVGNDVRTETYDQNGNLTAITTLVSFRYQALEAPTFLGLTYVQWGIVALVVVVAASIAFVLRRRFRRKKTWHPPEEAGSAQEAGLTSGPRDR